MPLRPNSVRAAALALAAAVLLLGGCGGSGLVQPAEIRPPIRVAMTDRAAPIRFSRLVLAVPRGSTIGVHVPGVFCWGPYDPVLLATSRGAIDEPDFIATFEQELSSAGYDVVGANRMFGQEDEEARTRFQIGARITRLGMDLCRHRNMLYLLSDAGFSGEASIAVEWEVYDPLVRRVVYAAATGGHAALEEPSPAAFDVLTRLAFAAAAANLAADRGFHDMLFGEAGAPARLFGAAGTAAVPVGSPGTGGGPGRPGGPAGGPAAEPLRIAPARPFAGPLTGHVESVRAAAVLIRTGSGRGSGAVIGADGYILTNAHVVGAADRVGVTLLNGRDLIGAVLRRDALRDVALVRVPGAGFTALPVRAAAPAVGEEVYAIGTPLFTELQGTVTRGIVSALRTHPQSGLPILQSDATIQHGNSGGPLVDRHGNLVGIAVSGHMDAGDRSIGLNFFIPIADALGRLNLRLDGGAGAGS